MHYELLLEENTQERYLIVLFNSLEMIRPNKQTVAAFHHINLHRTGVDIFARQSLIITLSDSSGADHQMNVFRQQFRNNNPGWTVWGFFVPAKKAQEVRERGTSYESMLQMGDTSIKIIILCGGEVRLRDYVLRRFGVEPPQPTPESLDLETLKIPDEANITS